MFWVCFQVLGFFCGPLRLDTLWEFPHFWGHILGFLAYHNPVALQPATCRDDSGNQLPSHPIPSPPCLLSFLVSGDQVDLSEREDDDLCVALREEQRELDRQRERNEGRVKEVVGVVEGKREEEER